MSALFSPDSKFMQVMNRVGDLLMLNLVFLFTCIPIVTIGAASSALYTVSFRFHTDREGKLFRTYFQAFREEFKRSTILWLIVLVFGAASGVNTCLFYLMPGPIRWTAILFCIFLVLILLIHAYIFPLVSQFNNSVGNTFKTALALSLGYLPWSLLITALNVFPFALLLLDLYHFLQMGFLWISLYFSTAAYVNSIILKKVFKPYLNDETKEEEPE